MLSLLMGEGAEAWALKRGIQLVSEEGECNIYIYILFIPYFFLKKSFPSELISVDAQKRHRNYLSRLQSENSMITPLETVGVLCMMDDTVVAGCSSGGLALASPGRVGHVSECKK